MPQSRNPINLAIIVCDSIIEDRESGKKTLVGIFNQLNSKSFPCTHPALSVFISLTEGQGCYQAQLQCVKSAGDEPILTLEGPVDFQDPKAIVELGFNIRAMSFPGPGTYEFHFLCDGVLLGQRPFQVRETGQEQ